jgi:phosphoribosylpyrophosphate synthetase
VASLVDAAALEFKVSYPAVTVVAKSPGGNLIGEVVATQLGCPVAYVEYPSDVSTLAEDMLTNRLVIVVDDGVETGRAAFGIGSALRTRNVRSLWLAVPVCPRQSEVTLVRVYDQVLAVVRPLARRSLRWHYEQF